MPVKPQATSKLGHTIGSLDVRTSYLLKKEKNDKVVSIEVNKQANTRGAKQVWVPKKIISTMMKSTKKVWIPKKK